MPLKLKGNLQRVPNNCVFVSGKNGFLFIFEKVGYAENEHC